MRADAVRLLTVHGAKGLEADTVFITDADPERPGTEIDDAAGRLAGRGGASTTLCVRLFRERVVRRRCAPCSPPRSGARARGDERLVRGDDRARRRLVFSATEPFLPSTRPSWWQRVQPIATTLAAPADDAVQAAAPAGVEALLRVLPRRARPEAASSGPQLTLPFTTPRRPPTRPHPLRGSTMPQRRSAAPSIEFSSGRQRPTRSRGRPSWPSLRRSSSAPMPRPCSGTPCAILDDPDGARFFTGPQIRWSGNEVAIGDRGEVLRIDRLVELAMMRTRPGGCSTTSCIQAPEDDDAVSRAAAPLSRRRRPGPAGRHRALRLRHRGGQGRRDRLRCRASRQEASLSRRLIAPSAAPPVGSNQATSSPAMPSAVAPVLRSSSPARAFGRFALRACSPRASDDGLAGHRQQERCRDDAVDAARCAFGPAEYRQLAARRAACSASRSSEPGQGRGMRRARALAVRRRRSACGNHSRRMAGPASGAVGRGGRGLARRHPARAGVRARRRRGPPRPAAAPHPRQRPRPGQRDGAWRRPRRRRAADAARRASAGATSARPASRLDPARAARRRRARRARLRRDAAPPARRRRRCCGSADVVRVIDRMAPRGRELVRLPWTTPQPIAEPLRAIANRSTAGPGAPALSERAHLPRRAQRLARGERRGRRRPGGAAARSPAHGRPPAGAAGPGDAGATGDGDRKPAHRRDRAQPAARHGALVRAAETLSSAQRARHADRRQRAGADVAPGRRADRRQRRARGGEQPARLARAARRGGRHGRCASAIDRVRLAGHSRRRCGRPATTARRSTSSPRCRTSAA